jgi:Flp pilus assembly pilin Flp
MSLSLLSMANRRGEHELHHGVMGECPPTPPLSLAPWCAFSRCASRSRGAVTVEYVVLVGLIGIGLAASLVAFGPSFVRYFEITRDLALLPAP